MDGLLDFRKDFKIHIRNPGWQDLTVFLRLFPFISMLANTIGATVGSLIGMLLAKMLSKDKKA